MLQFCHIIVIHCRWPWGEETEGVEQELKVLGKLEFAAVDELEVCGGRGGERGRASRACIWDRDQLPRCVLVCGRTKDHVENLLVAWLMASLECSFVVIAALSLPWGFINA